MRTALRTLSLPRWMAGTAEPARAARLPVFALAIAASGLVAAELSLAAARRARRRLRDLGWEQT